MRLTVRNFRFSPEGTGRRAAAGRGLAHLYVNGRLVAALRTPEYRLSAHFVPRGTHQVTARLYADDGSVWAVDGEPVESTADITVSEQDPSADPSAGANAGPAAAVGGTDRRSRTGGRGSPEDAEGAS
ncbi:Secreted protein OS=Streptomyces griseomycini OX=66895 GN=FHS37_004887 PE=4 SV=1 [Streptomyces griseomycini]